MLNRGFRYNHGVLIAFATFLLVLQLNAEESPAHRADQTDGQVDLWPNQKPPDKLDANSWTEKQKISSEVLRTKLTEPGGKRTFLTEGLKISGAWFSNGLNLTNI